MTPMTLLPILLGLSVTFAADDAGFVPLFLSALEGWTAEHGADFHFQDDILTCRGGGNYPSWLRSDRTYENFELTFDFRLGAYSEGGVFLHAPLHGRCTNVGYKVQLSDDRRNRQPVVISTGAIFGVVPPTEQASLPLGQWNTALVRFDWPSLQVTINGKLVQDLDVEANEELRDRLRDGYLGFQDRGKWYQIRNARIRALPARVEWTSLFDGQSFAGWSLNDKGSAAWTIEDGAIVANNGDGYLVSEPSFQDFHLELYTRTSPYANGGVFFRWKSLNPKDRGYEVQIEDILDSNNPTGSIYDYARAHDPPTESGEWYLMQIRVEGPRARVRVNGKNVAVTDELELIRSGPIALQMHRRDSTVWFKDLRIRPLAPETAASPAQ